MKAHTNWTADDIPDLTGRTALVTGGNSGVGFESAVELARHGAETILACRSIPRGEKALRTLRTLVPNGRSVLMALDLGNLSSIDQFVDNFGLDHDELHILMNNAGIMATPFRLTADGFESQFGTNHLGHFALTAQLMPFLLATTSARVVNVSSLSHRGERIDFESLGLDNYNRWRAYGRSKLANLLFTYELQRRLERAGISHTVSIATHPGVSRTNIANNMGIIGRLGMPLAAPFLQNAKMGALPLLRAATDPDARGGDYYGPDGRGERSGYPTLVESTPEAHDEEVARILWERSEELTGIRFDI